MEAKPIDTKMKGREAGMLITTGAQGVGKTYQNMYIIRDYVKDKIYNKVRGRKCLIFDTNGEYTREQFALNDIENFEPKRIALKDIPSWSRSNIVECRRIDAKNLGLAQKREIIEILLKKDFYSNGMLILEDINTYILSVTHMEEIVGGLVNLRHRGVDLLVSYQSLRPVEPRMWQNARWIRMHHQNDNVNDIKGKVSNPALMKIAQLIVDNRYDSGDKRFFLYIWNSDSKIKGKFTKIEFMEACRQYLNANKKYVREYKEMHNSSNEEAVEAQVKKFVEKYYGNPK